MPTAAAVDSRKAVRRLMSLAPRAIVVTVRFPGAMAGMAKLHAR
jgi:hypothetical protein